MCKDLEEHVWGQANVLQVLTQQYVQNVVVFNTQMGQKVLLLEGRRSVEKEGVRMNIEEIKELFIVSSFS